MRVLKFCFFMFIFTFLLHAQQAINPYASITTENNVISSVVDNNILYATTDGGTIEVFDLDENKNIKTITLDQIEVGFSNILGPTRVSHVDVYNHGEKLLIVSDDTEAGKALHVYENGSFKKIFSTKDRINISKAYFYDKNTVLLGLLGNEIILCDLNSKEFKYRVQPYWSMLTDYVLNDDRSLSYIAAESGIVYTMQTSNGAAYKNYDLHIDIILSVATKGDIMITGGADRKLAIYNLTTDSKHFISSSFLVYAVGLSPSGKLGAFVANENNDINIIDTDTKSIIAVLKGSKSFININKITFLSEDEILVSYNNKEILRWSLK